MVLLGMNLPAEEVQKFWARVDKRGDSDCWNWVGCIDGNGYGRFKQKGPFLYAHRVSYSLVHGEHPPCLDHLCRNRKCVNPVHLESVSIGENTLRGESAHAQNARKTHCKRGHPLDGDNLVLVSKGRNCRACAREYQSEYAKRWRAEHPERAREISRQKYERRKQGSGVPALAPFTAAQGEGKP